MLLSSNDVLKRGLEFMLCRFEGNSIKKNATLFHKHYGSSPLVLAEIWYDLTQSNSPEYQLDEKEKSEKGFRMYMMAHYFLWVYPKNSTLLSTRFQVCEKYARGDMLWKWIKRIAALKERKIVWPAHLDDPLAETFIVSVDGTDFRVNELKHDELPRDNAQCSHKFNHGAVKYEIAMAIFSSKCVWVNGPFRGGMHDLVMFREGLKQKVAPNKLVIADRGYQTSQPEESAILSIPDDMDCAELSNFKSRARLRHETFNGRLKFFNCLNETFRHAHDKHKFVFEAVVVIVQYQMDNGAELFAV